MTETQSITFAVRVAIADRVRKVCFKNENGLAVYGVGHDDRTIAEEFKVNTSVVRNIRQEIVGKLYERHGDRISDRDKVRARIKRQEQRHAKLVETVETLEGYISAMEDEQAVKLRELTNTVEKIKGAIGTATGDIAAIKLALRHNK